MNATHAQIAKIHILKKQLVESGYIGEGDYREHLLDFGVKHSNHLNYEQAKAFIIMYESGSFRQKVRIKTGQEVENIKQYGFGEKKYSELDKRDLDFARSSKLRMIEALWREVSNSKTDESLQLFIKHRTGVDHITFLLNDQAKVVITALRAMKQSQPRKKTTMPRTS